jgi:hypothetical protein
MIFTEEERAWLEARFKTGADRKRFMATMPASVKATRAMLAKRMSAHRAKTRAPKSDRGPHMGPRYGSTTG